MVNHVDGAESAESRAADDSRNLQRSERFCSGSGGGGGLISAESLVVREVLVLVCLQGFPIDSDVVLRVEFVEYIDMRCGAFRRLHTDSVEFFFLHGREVRETDRSPTRSNRDMGLGAFSLAIVVCGRVEILTA